jgi:hypothetical protein
MGPGGDEKTLIRSMADNDAGPVYVVTDLEIRAANDGDVTIGTEAGGLTVASE